MNKAQVSSDQQQLVGSKGKRKTSLMDDLSSIDEEGTGSGVEEETTEIHETTDREHAIDEEGAGIVKRDTPGIEKAAAGSGFEGAMVKIDMTPNIEKRIKRDEQKEIEKAGAYIIKKRRKFLGDQQQLVGSKGKPKTSLMDDLSSIISALLIPRYTPGETSAFRFLHTRCTRSRKLPREWKCLMAYHRLAWNILSLTPDSINRVEGWQVQLIAWIFVCWEWRDLITILIKDWNKLKVLRNWKAKEGPSLREIVEHYIDERWPADKESENFRGNEKSATKKEDDATEKEEKTSGNMITISSEDTEGDDYLKKILKEQKEMREALAKVQEDMREALRKVQEDMREMREMVKNKVFKGEEHNKGESSQPQGTTVEDMEGQNTVQQYTTAEEREEWNKLRDALRRYNVSMDGFQAFQKFRFYCQPGHLPWPLPEQA
ncbi:uncharacterized protein LOC131875355 [Cryptomeria japonica]|uniref:uncharacterized protein LOC131875355 n=1 Tax=Cryptomeria japonica TaxID=3369 RepID=UPI0027DA705C|nr:uncharacterized protein LOC131875355 [Cryptomeria japonica]